jgi:AmmeMemoRadiSam system protein B
MPSPSPEHPGLLVRDPYRYTDAVLVIPPVLVSCLECFDGRQTGLDLRAVLVRLTNQLDVSDLAVHLTDTLSAAGFLEDDIFAGMRERRLREFAELPVREPAHAGAAYPAEFEPLRETLTRYMAQDGDRPPRPEGGLFGIAAPHVSPEGGWQSYRAAYHALLPDLRDRTFVILGTSHYGEPERFGLTRKPFVTPLGQSTTDTGLVDLLEQRGGAAVSMEDYCHSFEHTIEFQVVFLQYLFGPGVRILPVLCGQFAHSIYRGGLPEENDGTRRFLEALGELADREAGRLFWVLGIDMAHMGARYGDQFTAVAGQGRMAEVAERDSRRIDRINAGDAHGFWDLVQQNRDDLKWCGSSPLYTFLKAAPGARGELLRYEQWNIDPRSVVSFAGMGFYR